MENINFNPFPILTTDKLSLRHLELDDCNDIFNLRSDENVNKYLNRKPCTTIDEASVFINIINENIKKNNSIYWAISLTKTKTFVGTICLFDFSIENNSCEIGFELITKFQGQGIMQEAVKSVIDYAFQTLRFQKILAFTDTNNQNSIKILSKFNFVKSIKTDIENPNLNLFTLLR